MAKYKPNRTHIWISIVLAAITLAVFYRTLGNDFIVAYDDGSYITTNENLHYGLTPEGISWALSTHQSSNWHPVTWMSHLLDYQLYGLHPAGHHATNLLLHMANVILLFLFLRRITSRPGSTQARSEWKSAFVAALFAIHPLHVESVAWIAERKDVLSTLFWILTMWAYVRFVEEPVFGRRMTLITLFAVGLMAKPMLVTLPLILLLLDYWPLRRFETLKARRLLWEKAPLFVMSAISCVVTFWAQAAGKAVAPIGKLPLEWRIGNALISYIAYLWKMIWPVKLAVLYPWTPQGISYPQALGSLLLLIAISIAVFKLSRRRPYLAFGWLWYLVTLIPVIGIVQVGEQTIADRYTYVPLIGIFMMIAWLLPLDTNFEHRTSNAERRTRKPERTPNTERPTSNVERPILVIAGMVIVSLMVSSWVYVGYWHDGITLCKRAIAVTKDNYTMHLNLAIAYGDEERWQDSIKEYREAIKILPRDPESHNNLAIILYAVEDYSGAWKEVHVCENLGWQMRQIFLDDLAAKMPDPGR